MPVNTRDPVPPPVIGKIGPYTVFMTPPSTPKPSGPAVSSPTSTVHPPVQASPPPPVLPPPQQFEKPVPSYSLQDGSISGFFKSAVTKVQNAHSSLDDRLANWFGLNHSKYQWALDDYYNKKVMEMEGGKAKEVSATKLQNV